MQVFLGDEITLINRETWVTGKVSGIVLHDKTKELERIYIHNIDFAFYVHDGWQIADYEDENEGSENE